MGNAFTYTARAAEASNMDATAQAGSTSVADQGDDSTPAVASQGFITSEELARQLDALREDINLAILLAAPEEATPEVEHAACAAGRDLYNTLCGSGVSDEDGTLAERCSFFKQALAALQCPPADNPKRFSPGNMAFTDTQCIARRRDIRQSGCCQQGVNNLNAKCALKIQQYCNGCAGAKPCNRSCSMFFAQ